MLCIGDSGFTRIFNPHNMIPIQSQKLSKASTPNQHLMETRIVAQEVVQCLETIYHCTSFIKTLPSHLIQLLAGPPNQDAPLLTQQAVRILEAFYHTTSFLKTLYLFTASDFPTFAIPTILFGLFSALSGPVLTTSPSPNLVDTTSRIPTALALIWTNLLIFNISNQRTPSAVAEDRVNKPHRPIPSGRIDMTAARRVNLCLVPCVLGLAWAAGAWHETLLLLAMQWMYNDLRGCDESLLLRNALIAVGYALYAAMALGIMLAPGAAITTPGRVWLGAVGVVMLCTQHICDIKDARGDRLRGRRSAPIVLGDALCRWSVAVPVLVCSLACPAFFCLGSVARVLTLAAGGLVAGRTLWCRDLKSDTLTWKLWALRTVGLFALPLVANLERSGAVVDCGLLWEAVMHYACPGHDCAERLNVLAVSGVAMAVKGSSVVERVGAGGHTEGNVTVPRINVVGADL